MRIALLTLVACETVPAPSPPPTTQFVLADVLQRYDEGTGAGGQHYLLTLLDGTNRQAHAGGHALHQNLLPPGTVVVQFGPRPLPPRQPALAVVELDDSATHDICGLWCLGARFDVRAKHARRVASRAEGERLISRMVRADRWLEE